jgi:hypothetical protein
MELNVQPYFDDFSQAKKYQRILFKPGFAVQARELTQLQTILQNQIEQFGSHIFKDGSIVHGLKQTYQQNVLSINISFNYDPSLLEGKTVTFSGGATAIVKKGTIVDSKKYIFVSILNGIKVSPAETLTVETYTATVASDITSINAANLFSVSEGIMFANGFFAYVNPQTKNLGVSSIADSFYIGFDVVESTVDVDTDDSLLDNSIGSNNYSAPGADRLKLDLQLNAYQYDPTGAVDYPKAPKNFIQIATVEYGTLIQATTKPEYSELETALANRTFDESGNYTVRPFIASIDKSIKGRDDYMTLKVGAGKAYVAGYEYETTGTTNIEIYRGRDVAPTVYDDAILAHYGDYVHLVASPYGLINFNALPTVNLYSVTYASAGVGTKIGTARLKHYKFDGNNHRLYLSEISVDTGKSFADVKSCMYGSTFKADFDTTVGLVREKASVSSLVFSVPQHAVKTMLPDAVANMDYRYRKFVTLNFVNNVATMSLASGESFIAGSNNDLVKSQYFNIVPTSGTTPAPGTDIIGDITVTIAGGTATFTRSGTSASFSASAQVEVKMSNIMSKQKTLTLGTQYFTAAELATDLSLKIADGVRLISVRDDAGNDYTSRYDFYTGQTDNLYDHCGIRLIGTSPLVSNTELVRLEVTFSYFKHSDGAGFFTVDSYTGSGALYDQIPYVRMSDGSMLDLASSIDFRPRKLADGSIEGGYIVSPFSEINASYQYYVGRIDKLVLTKDKKFDLITGVPAVNPKVPADLPDAMTLYVIEIPAYTYRPADVKMTYVENRRYTMRDIGKIDTRVSKLEYYASLSLLEKQAADEKVPGIAGIDKFKNGILVDSFAGHSVGDVTSPEYNCSIDQENRVLRPRFDQKSLDMEFTLQSGMKRHANLITLDYDTVPYIEQPYATKTVNLNPYGVFSWVGHMTLSPSSDNWVDEKTNPAVIVNTNGVNDAFSIISDTVPAGATLSTRWNSWQSVVKGISSVGTEFSSDSTTTTSGYKVTDTTAVTGKQTLTYNETTARIGLEIASAPSTINTDLGSKVVDVSLAPYIRSREVKFTAIALQPNTSLNAYFDNVLVTDYVNPAICFVINAVSVDPTVKTFVQQGTNNEVEVIGVFGNRIYGRIKGADITVGNIVAATDTGTVTYSISKIIRNTSTGTKLATNEFGEICGIFVVPNNDTLRFTVGDRAFRLSDEIDSKDSRCIAETRYTAQGLNKTTEKTIISTRVNVINIQPKMQVETAVVGVEVKDYAVSTISYTTDITPVKQYVLNANKTLITEGESVNFTVSTQNVNDGESIPYTITGVSSNDITAPLTGTLVIKDNAASLNVLATEDLTTEGLENIAFTISPANVTPQTVSVAITDTSTAPTIKFVLTANKTVVNEGDTITFSLATTGVANGINVPYSISGVNSADISGGVMTGNLIISSNAASLTVTMSSDSLTEGVEYIQFTITPPGYDTQSVAAIVNDTSLSTPAASYVLNANRTSVNEGQSVTITLNTQNVSNGTTVAYTITPKAGSTLTAAELGIGSLTGNFTVNSNTASITITPTVDVLTEGTETFIVSLDSVVCNNLEIDIVDTSTSPTYVVNANKDTVSEGGTVTFAVSAIGMTGGAISVPYTLTGTGITSSDLNGASLSGTLSGLNNNTVSLPLTISTDAATEGDESLTFTATIGGVNYTKTVSIIDSSQAAVTYAVVSDMTSIAEGSTVTFTVQTTNLPASTQLQYRISGVSSGDISVAPIGYLTINGSGSATLAVQLVADSSTEGQETLVFDVYGVANTIVATATVLVQDTSTSPSTYSLTSNASSIYEGGSVTFTLTTTNVASGTLVPYSITGISTSDLVSGSQLSGFLTLTGGSASHTVTLSEDALTEGTEVLTFTINHNGNTRSQNVSVIDTSSSVPTFVLNSDKSNVVEGGTVRFTINTTNYETGVIPWSLSGTGITSGDVNIMSGNLSVVNGTAYVDVQITSDGTTEGDETFTFTATPIGGYSCAPVSVTISDTSGTPVTYNLTTTTPTVNEGASVTVTLTTTGLSAGTTIPYAIGGTGVTAADIVGGLTGNFTLNSSGTATTTFTVANDFATEGGETLVFTTTHNGISRSLNIFVSDTSQNVPTFVLNVSSIS